MPTSQLANQQRVWCCCTYPPDLRNTSRRCNPEPPPNALMNMAAPGSPDGAHTSNVRRVGTPSGLNDDWYRCGAHGSTGTTPRKSARETRSHIHQATTPTRQRRTCTQDVTTCAPVVSATTSNVSMHLGIMSSSSSKNMTYFVVADAAARLRATEAPTLSAKWMTLHEHTSTVLRNKTPTRHMAPSTRTSTHVPQQTSLRLGVQARHRGRTSRHPRPPHPPQRFGQRRCVAWTATPGRGCVWECTL